MAQKDSDEDGDEGGAAPMDGVAPAAEAAAGAAAGGDAAGGDAAEPATDQWVQCDRCRTWRIVPDAEWPEVEADPRDVCPRLALPEFAAFWATLLGGQVQHCVKVRRLPHLAYGAHVEGPRVEADAGDVRPHQHTLLWSYTIK